MLTTFYVLAAVKSFQRAYGDDPNVISAECGDNNVSVTVKDLDSAVFPNQIDGISVVYAEALKEAS